MTAAEHPGAPTDRGPGSPLLRVEDLDVEFTVDGRPVPAIVSASWELARGEVLAVVGESGSGKSTTALALLGLLPAGARARGTALFEGQDLLSLDEKAMREVRGSRIAMIFQDPTGSLDPVFTIGSQMVELLRTHHPGMTREAARARAVELLEQVDVPDPARRLGQYPHELSGGQCQRVMIAMALSGEPEVLLADEPTTALDVTVQQEVLDLLHHLRERTSVAVLLITHDMGVVADLADRVVVMRHGRVVETAPVRQLFAAPGEEYTRMLLSSVPGRTSSARAEGSAPEADERARGGRREGRPYLEVEDLVVSYRGRGRRAETVKAVDGVSLAVRRGEVLGLVGESGSGKSTIGKVVIGLAPVASGRVHVGDVDLGAAPRRRVREVQRTVGVVFQNPTASLDPRRSVGAALEEPLRVLGGLRGGALDARRDELLEAVELPASWERRYPHELSGGQRQRVAIARAISLEPQLLVADEPTSALDVSVQATVLRLLAELQQRLGFACLFISHDLAVVEQLCDRVAVLRAGRVVEEGTTARVLGQPDADFTRELLAAAPVPDPQRQSERRRERLAGVA
ncbi:ABC transporter ATP-binding protein [Pseudokineococcus sp. 1T1Z-3]|uniref:ABC transporter ATP-binding protein n=1 Tax=Pseudokineococcus sp. 1T1Z-3 TaxID=3132745 RepID=UPI00309B0128